MSKFYIQSDRTRFIVAAADAEGAALWMFDQLVRRLPQMESDVLKLNDQRIMLLVEEVLDQLDNEIHVSEIGYGRADSATLDSELIAKQWLELLTAARHLFRQL